MFSSVLLSVKISFVQDLINAGGHDALGLATRKRAPHLPLHVVKKKRRARAKRGNVSERETSYFKIRNREYLQMSGREELFERERHKEPVVGWHCCAVACAGLEHPG